MMPIKRRRRNLPLLPAGVATLLAEVAMLPYYHIQGKVWDDLWCDVSAALDVVWPVWIKATRSNGSK